MTNFTNEICRIHFSVGLRIGVDAPALDAGRQRVRLSLDSYPCKWESLSTEMSEFYDHLVF